MNCNEICVAWQNLRYEVTTTNNRKFTNLNFSKKLILRELNGAVEFHQLVALMGPSGAGKTSLIKCISGEVNSGLSNGSRLFVNSRYLREELICCYIEQHAHQCIEGRLRVRQILRYAYLFKNGSVCKSNKSGKVDKSKFCFS